MKKKNNNSNLTLALAVLTAVVFAVMLCACNKDAGSGPVIRSITITGPESVEKGLAARYIATVDTDSTHVNAKRVGWTLVAEDKAPRTVLIIRSGDGILDVVEDEGMESMKIIATSMLDLTVATEITVQITPKRTNDSMMESFGVVDSAAPAQPKNQRFNSRYRIFSFWEAPTGASNNFLVDDGGYLALGNVDQWLPFSAWYLMKDEHGRKALKNAGSGNYISIEGIERYSTYEFDPQNPINDESLERMIASQPRVLPFENKDSFFWDFDEELRSPIFHTSIFNWGYNADDPDDTGGALSHECHIGLRPGKQRLPSQGNPELSHVQWRYDRGSLTPPNDPRDRAPADWEDNAPWIKRLGYWADIEPKMVCPCTCQDDDTNFPPAMICYGRGYNPETNFRVSAEVRESDREPDHIKGTVTMSPLYGNVASSSRFNKDTVITVNAIARTVTPAAPATPTVYVFGGWTGTLPSEFKGYATIAEATADTTLAEGDANDDTKPVIKFKAAENVALIANFVEQGETFASYPTDPLEADKPGTCDSRLGQCYKGSFYVEGWGSYMYGIYVDDWGSQGF